MHCARGRRLAPAWASEAIGAPSRAPAVAACGGRGPRRFAQRPLDRRGRRRSLAPAPHAAARALRRTRRREFPLGARARDVVARGPRRPRRAPAGPRSCCSSTSRASARQRSSACSRRGGGTRTSRPRRRTTAARACRPSCRGAAGAELRSLRGDQGARALLRGSSALTLVDMPEAALDIDTPADLAKLR